MQPQHKPRFERSFRRGLIETLDNGQKVVYPLGERFNGVVEGAPGRFWFVDEKRKEEMYVIFLVLTTIPLALWLYNAGGIYSYFVVPFLLCHRVLFNFIFQFFRIKFVVPVYRTTVTPWRRQVAGELVLPNYSRITTVLSGVLFLICICMVWHTKYSWVSVSMNDVEKKEALLIDGVAISAISLILFVYQGYHNWRSNRARRAQSMAIDRVG